MNLHSYPSVYAIGHPAIAELFNGPVLIEEKVDGSQFSFAVSTDGAVCMRSKGAEVHAEDPGMFKAAVSTVHELREQLTPGWVYRGEFLAKPKHNVLAYERVPSRNLILFDINTGDECYLDRRAKEKEAERIRLEIVPAIYEGVVTSSEELFSLIDRDSILGNRVEGIVAKNYARFGRDKKVLMGKFVSERFKESHSKEWRANNPTLTDVVDRVIATLKTEARWQKAVQHLTDSGRLEHSPRDIGALIAEVKQDVLREETDFIKEKLYEWSKDRIARAVAAGLPEWYKRKLVEDGFAHESEEATA